MATSGRTAAIYLMKYPALATGHHRLAAA